MGSIVITSKTQGVKGNAKLQKTPRVKTIEVSQMDEGSANDGTFNIVKKGFVYGRVYTLEAIDFLYGVPQHSQIKWEVEYIDENGDLKVISSWKPIGKKVEFKVDNFDLLGVSLTFYAYVACQKEEAKIEIWSHYRFRYFDRKILENEIRQRKNNTYVSLASQINQARTALCGMACIFYLLAKNDPDQYIKYILDLHKKGIAKCKEYTCKPSSDMYDFNPLKGKMGGLNYMDWISLAVTRNSESDFNLYTGEEGQEFGAINWPGIIMKLGKKLLGYNNVDIDYYSLTKTYIEDHLNSNKKLKELVEKIDTLYENDNDIILMIDGGMLNNDSEYSWKDFQQYHWIVYEGELKLYNGEEQNIKPLIKSKLDLLVSAGESVAGSYADIKSLSFMAFSWAKLSVRHMQRNAYVRNYYAYISLKK